MKQILVELDDRCARDLERVAPAKKRMRAEFIRLAIRSAIDQTLDRATEAAYRRNPLEDASVTADTSGWDPANGLVKRAPPSRAIKRSKHAAKRAKHAA